MGRTLARIRKERDLRRAREVETGSKSKESVKAVVTAKKKETAVPRCPPVSFFVDQLKKGELIAPAFVSTKADVDDMGSIKPCYPASGVPKTSWVRLFQRSHAWSVPACYKSSYKADNGLLTSPLLDPATFVWEVYIDEPVYESKAKGDARLYIDNLGRVFRLTTAAEMRYALLPPIREGERHFSLHHVGAELGTNKTESPSDVFHIGRLLLSACSGMSLRQMTFMTFFQVVEYLEVFGNHPLLNSHGFNIDAFFRSVAKDYSRTRRVASATPRRSLPVVAERIVLRIKFPKAVPVAEKDDDDDCDATESITFDNVELRESPVSTTTEAEDEAKEAEAEIEPEEAESESETRVDEPVVFKFGGEDEDADEGLWRLFCDEADDFEFLLRDGQTRSFAPVVVDVFGDNFP